MNKLDTGPTARGARVHPARPQIHTQAEKPGVSEIAEAVEHEMPVAREMRERFHARPVADRTFVAVTMTLAVVILILVFGMALALISQSRASLAAFGWHFHRQHRMGPGQRSIRRAAIHIRHLRVVGIGANNRGAAQPRRGAMPERDGAGLAQPPAGISGRVAGCDSERRLRAVGGLCARTVAARRSGTAALAILWLYPAVLTEPEPR